MFGLSVKRSLFLLGFAVLLTFVFMSCSTGDDSKKSSSSSAADNKTTPQPVQPALGDKSLAEPDKQTIATYNFTSCAILKDAKLKCWGQDFFGKLGNGSGLTNTIGDGAGEMAALNPIAGLEGVTSIGVGLAHVCAVAKEEVYCWGNNIKGSLATGSDTAENPIRHHKPVKAKIANKAKKVVVGYSTTCAILSGEQNGLIKCWGQNDHGQVGNGTKGGSAFNDGVGNLDSEVGENLPFVKFGEGPHTVLDIDAGQNHVCAVSPKNELWCWGENRAWSLSGIATGESTKPVKVNTTTGVKAVALGDTHTCVIHVNNTVSCWGNALLRPSQSSFNINLGADRTAVKIAAAKDMTCVILDNGELKCWGKNDSNPRFGTSTASSVTVEAIALGTGKKAKQVAMSAGVVCVVLDDNGVKCWGVNTKGELGQGNTTTHGPAGKEVSAMLKIVNVDAKF